jgi:hypothetical protein
MSEHTLLTLFEGLGTAVLLAIFGGIISIHVRLARIETKIAPIWDWWNQEEGKRHAAALVSPATSSTR